MAASRKQVMIECLCCRVVRFQYNRVPVSVTISKYESELGGASAGANCSKATGLGFSTPAAEQPNSYGSVYDSFRSGRSGRYHNNLAKNQFAAAASRGST